MLPDPAGQGPGVACVAEPVGLARAVPRRVAVSTPEGDDVPGRAMVAACRGPADAPADRLAGAFPGRLVDAGGHRPVRHG